jgi:hypothetical protein
MDLALIVNDSCAQTEGKWCSEINSVPAPFASTGRDQQYSGPIINFELLERYFMV